MGLVVVGLEVTPQRERVLRKSVSGSGLRASCLGFKVVDVKCNID